MSEQNNKAKKSSGIGVLGWMCITSIIIFIGWMYYVSIRRPFTNAELNEESKRPLEKGGTLSETPREAPRLNSRQIKGDQTERSGQRTGREAEIRLQAPRLHEPNQVKPVMKPSPAPPPTFAPRPVASYVPRPAATPTIVYPTANKRNYGKEP